MKFNLSRFGKPEKNRSGRKEKTGSPSRSEERKGVEKAEGSDDATTRAVAKDVSPVSAKIEKKHESEIKNKLLDIDIERKLFMGWAEGIYDSIDKNKVKERKEVERIIEEFKKVKGSDATIQAAMDKVRSMLEPWEIEKSIREELRQIKMTLRHVKLLLVWEKTDSFANFRESLSEVEAVMKSGDVDGARKQLNLLLDSDEYQVLLSRREERYFGYEKYKKFGYERYEKELSKPMIEEARRVRDHILESQGKLPLSKEEFDRYFSSEDFEVSADLRQQNVGDCYLIAAIHSMSCSPNFELFCRSSMKRLSDGSWRVKIPLLSEDGEWITVTKEEILPQKNRKFFSWHKRSWHKRKKLDTRRWLQPVQGKEGLQVLEAAYIKKKFSVVDRLAAEGGQGDEALMCFGGDNLVRFDVNSQSLKTLDSEQVNPLDSFLESFDPEIHMATVSFEDNSLHRVAWTVKTLVPNHAYSIAGVNAEEGTITLANPWDTSRPLEMSFDRFKENFSRFQAVRVDSASLLLNMREAGWETGNIQ